MGAHLAPREERTLALMATGMTAKEAAARLGITTTTAKNYLSRSYQKLGVQGLVAALVARGYCTPPNPDDVA